MKRTIPFWLAALGVLCVPATNWTQVPAPEVLVNQLSGGAPNYRLKWKQRVGITTFRSTILSVNGRVIVPSNGTARDSLSDSGDGVFILNGRDGSVIRQISPRVPGRDGSLLRRLTALADTDVNGVAIDQQALYFGDD